MAKKLGDSDGKIFGVDEVGDPRWGAIVAAVLLLWPLLGTVRGVWEDLCILEDGTRGVAAVGAPRWGSGKSVHYRYKVDGHIYRAVGHTRHFDAFRAPHELPVYYSSSRPWLSRLDMPDEHPVWGALPIVIIILLFEFMLLIAIVFSPRAVKTYRPPSATKPSPP